MKFLCASCCLALLLFLDGSFTRVLADAAIFNTPEMAIEALAQAAASKDKQKLLSIFGNDGEELLESGDDIADENALAMFSGRYDERHVVEKQAEKVRLFLGMEEWPFPIPLAKGENGWYFDSAQGREEVLDRRIGRDELIAINVCRAYVDAQKAYFEQPLTEDGRKSYALKFISDRGRKNGLFWPRKPNEKASPLGAVAAKVFSEGYGERLSERPAPYAGYVFRIIRAQGPSASGGRMSYLDKEGRMMNGFALFAYPVKWGNSGVMSFLVNQDGVVYQKNLGAGTAKIALSVKEYDPDSSWEQVSE